MFIALFIDFVRSKSCMHTARLYYSSSHGVPSDGFCLLGVHAQSELVPSLIAWCVIYPKSSTRCRMEGAYPQVRGPPTTVQNLIDFRGRHTSSPSERIDKLSIVLFFCSISRNAFTILRQLHYICVKRPKHSKV